MGAKTKVFHSYFGSVYYKQRDPEMRKKASLLCKGKDAVAHLEACGTPDSYKALLGLPGMTIK